MVSRKKAKGKARKAKKEEEKKDAHDDSSAAAAQQREHEGALEAQLQMQRLIIDSLPSPCKHGFDPFSAGHICDRFLRLYLETFNASSGNSSINAILDATDAVEDKYPEVLYDSSKMKHILSYFSSVGTQQILDGDDDAARITSAVIVVFEEFIASKVNKTKAGVHTKNCWRWSIPTITHSSAFSESALHVLVWIRSIKKSNPSKRWACATIKSVLLVGRLNAARWCTAPGAVLHITVPVIVRRLLGQIIERSVRKGRSKMPSSSKR
mmetsp:Transcript_9212/g.18521  ORF Transcript_9212/g.18521 Transcript_9212/m.18521 type:complete len:267 (+) Transcript_9212:61-861(+)